jgi:cell wall-associated NlpC family hydrolase
VAPVARKATPSERKTIHGLRKRVVATAMSKQGATYRWGAAGPDSFDCSGLMLWTYLTAVGMSLPHYSGAQMQVTRPIERTRLRKGDLLFYGPGGSQHVTMYIGRRLQIGASSSRTGIVIDSIDSPYRLSNYAGAGRVIRLKHLRSGLLP